MKEKYEEAKQTIAKIKNMFSSSAKSLFSITRDEFFEFNGALYGVLIAKPNRALSSSLGIQKEIVVLCTNFDNLQVRTVDAVMQVIKNASSRYESSIALIIHRDKNGNINLKNWGREKGISILPIFYKNNELDNLDLERAMCYELYSHDPFDITGPVSSDEQFFGRRTEAQDLARKLQLGQIRSLLGIRKIGKTSIINRVINELKNYNCLSIMIDCSRDEIWSMRSEELMKAISVAINTSIETKENYIRLEHINDKNNKIYESVKAIEKNIININKPVVLIFDEVDYITPSSPVSDYWRTGFNIFWRNMRVVYQELARSNGTLSIVIGGVSSKWFSVGEIDGIENAVLSFIPEEYLSPLPRGASVAMIKKIGKTAGLTFPEVSADFIAMETADMPYWIRKACSYIHRNIEIENRPLELKLERVQPLIETFIKNEGAAITEVAIRHLFGIYPELKKDFELIASCDIEDTNDKIKSVLVRYGVILNNNTPKLAGNMIMEGYKIYKEFVGTDTTDDMNNKNNDTTSKTFGLGEWADEIAVISKRRNILEKKMRDIALNFIKMDSLMKSDRKNAKERILAILPQNQREALSHMTADEIIEKYLWTDLVKLYSTKEWQLFERMIGDKKSFTLNTSIINDRPDAHAKNMDAADFALYRRSLKYVEDIISKLG